jgi:hypothetical protein
MRVALQAWVASGLFALALAWVGPSLDAGPYPVPVLNPLDAGEITLLEREARQLCDREAGQNSGWIQLADGQIACTTKHGRRLRASSSPLANG